MPDHQARARKLSFHDLVAVLLPSAGLKCHLLSAEEDANRSNCFTGTPSHILQLVAGINLMGKNLLCSGTSWVGQINAQLTRHLDTS